jgi:uncharacterized protein (DUF433 family)
MEKSGIMMPAPLVRGEDGTIRVAGTRITLDSIVHAYQHGDSAEQILDSFPSLTLKDIYGAIAYYLQFPEQIEKYLLEQSVGAARIRTMIDSQLDSQKLRERIRARQASRLHAG